RVVKSNAVPGSDVCSRLRLGVLNFATDIEKVFDGEFFAQKPRQLFASICEKRCILYHCFVQLCNLSNLVVRNRTFKQVLLHERQEYIFRPSSQQKRHSKRTRLVGLELMFDLTDSLVAILKAGSH